MFVRKQPWLPKSKALRASFQHVTGHSFNAHDALEDSKALQDFMLHSRLEQSLAATKESAVHILDALKDLENKDDIFQRSKSFQLTDFNSLLSKYMVDKMAKAGLLNPVLVKVHKRLGTKGVVALLASAGKKRARVTNSTDILTKIIFSLKKGQK